MKTLIGMVVLSFSILHVHRAMADDIPLVAWSTSVTGNGSGHITTNENPSQLFFSILNTVSGTEGEWGYATSASSLAAITSNRMYVLSTSASIYGQGAGGIALLANGSSVAGTFVVTPGGVLSNYMVSFTTGGPEDSHIGQDLKVQISVGSNLSGGGAQATFNSITVSTFPPQPILRCRQSGASQILISWPNVYTGFSVESTGSPTGSWSGVTNPVTSQSSNFVVSVDTASDQQRFFRLRK